MLGLWGRKGKGLRAQGTGIFLPSVPVPCACALCLEPMGPLPLFPSTKPCRVQQNRGADTLGECAALLIAVGAIGLGGLPVVVQSRLDLPPSRSHSHPAGFWPETAAWAAAPPGRASFSLSFPGGSLLDALNAIVRPRGDLGWTIHYCGERATREAATVALRIHHPPSRTVRVIFAYDPYRPTDPCRAQEGLP